MTAEPGRPPGDPGSTLDAVEEQLLGEAPSLTRRDVAEQAGVPVEVAEELWRLLGFPRAEDDDAAFTARDVEALRLSVELVHLGILSPDRQAALVRTWGRSFARLAEWQTALLADVAAEHVGADGAPADPAAQAVELARLSEQVLPRVERLQDYVWRRHLAGATSRALTLEAGAEGDVTTLAVVFVDIVGFTSRSKELTEAELVGWLESFESRCSDVVVDRGGRIIKALGDAVLFVCEDLAAAVDAALVLTELGHDRSEGIDGDEEGFPEVRAGLAHGEVVVRLGDVFGPTVNIASRLTSLARPGTVLVDEGAHDAMTAGDHSDPAPFQLRRLRRTSVKGYSRLPSWAARRQGRAGAQS